MEESASPLPDFEKRLHSGEAPVGTVPKETVPPALDVTAIDLEARKAALTVEEATRQSK